MKSSKTNGAKRLRLLAIALIAVIGFSFIACSDDDGGGGGSGGGGGNTGGGGGGGGVTFNSLYEFEMWLTDQPDNTPATAYTVKLNVSSLKDGGASVNGIMQANANKYLSLDLSGSSITRIDYFGTSQDLDGAYTFWFCSNLTGITIPNSITSIGNAAFTSCTSLVSVTIPNSVTSIGVSAFAGCISLPSINIPSSVTSIGVSAFAGCTSLASITIPNKVTSIKDGLFELCSSLPSINIPNGVTSIEKKAFKDCASLASVIIPAAVTSIESEAFRDCTSLTSVKFEGTISSNGFDKNAFYGSGNLRDKYFDANGGIGTYKRAKGGSAWAKQ
jgi:hypothetical protein